MSLEQIPNEPNKIRLIKRIKPEQNLGNPENPITVEFAQKPSLHELTITYQPKNPTLGRLINEFNSNLIGETRGEKMTGGDQYYERKAIDITNLALRILENPDVSEEEKNIVETGLRVKGWRIGEGQSEEFDNNMSTIDDYISGRIGHA